ncbi:MAG: hypothetical protein NTY20_02095 [Candidatus Aenigmarchaeota archaeon]|nr:hypothetical protein [Candidatus Aenigmarchaeota archaeon]
MNSAESIQFEIDRIQKGLIKMEYKQRRLFEEHGGNPPPETVRTYDRIMEVDAANLQKLKKELEGGYSANSY